MLTTAIAFIQNLKRDLNYFLSLKEIKKTKTLSVFCSDKNFTEGHRKRLDFVYGLKDHFGRTLIGMEMV